MCLCIQLDYFTLPAPLIRDIYYKYKVLILLLLSLEALAPTVARSGRLFSSRRRFSRITGWSGNWWLVCASYTSPFPPVDDWRRECMSWQNWMKPTNSGNAELLRRIKMDLLKRIVFKCYLRNKEVYTWKRYKNERKRPRGRREFIICDHGLSRKHFRVKLPSSWTGKEKKTSMEEGRMHNAFIGTIVHTTGLSWTAKPCYHQYYITTALLLYCAINTTNIIILSYSSHSLYSYPMMSLMLLIMQ